MVVFDIFTSSSPEHHLVANMYIAHRPHSLGPIGSVWPILWGRSDYWNLAIQTTLTCMYFQMACHDYTNKLSYTMGTRMRDCTNTASDKIRFGGNTSPPKPSREKAAKQQMSSSKKQTSGHLRKSLSNKHSRVTKVENEDKNYLAHGTGIPR